MNGHLRLLIITPLIKLLMIEFVLLKLIFMLLPTKSKTYYNLYKNPLKVKSLMMRTSFSKPTLLWILPLLKEVLKMLLTMKKFHNIPTLSLLSKNVCNYSTNLMILLLLSK